MARLAVFVDGGYMAKVGATFRTWIDIGKLADEIREQLGRTNFEQLPPSPLACQGRLAS